MVEQLPQFLISPMSSNTRLEFDYDKLLEVALLKGKIILPKECILHKPISMSPGNFGLLLFDLFLQFCMDEL